MVVPGLPVPATLLLFHPQLLIAGTDNAICEGDVYTLSGSGNNTLHLEIFDINATNPTYTQE